jgi:hypothetical protein
MDGQSIQGRQARLIVNRLRRDDETVEVWTDPRRGGRSVTPFRLVDTPRSLQRSVSNTRHDSGAIAISGLTVQLVRWLSEKGWSGPDPDEGALIQTTHLDGEGELHVWIGGDEPPDLSSLDVDQRQRHVWMRRPR